MIKIQNKFQKIYLTYYNLLTTQGLWQAHHQIFLIIFLKEFIKLNVNMDTMIKNVKLAELNISILTVFLNAQILKMVEQNINVYVVIKIINKSLMKG